MKKLLIVTIILLGAAFFTFKIIGTLGKFGSTHLKTEELKVFNSVQYSALHEAIDSPDFIKSICDAVNKSYPSADFQIADITVSSTLTDDYLYVTFSFNNWVRKRYDLTKMANVLDKSDKEAVKRNKVIVAIYKEKLLTLKNELTKP
jgi:hypothetical protein